MNEIIETVKYVLRQRKYRDKFIMSFFLAVLLSSFLMTFISLPGLLYGEIIFAPEVTPRNALFLASFSLLAALAVTLNLYRYDETKKMKIGKESVGFFGLFFGLFTSACSICYPLILSILGIPAALALLPFGGIELQILSIALLAISIFFSARSVKSVCSPKKSIGI